MSYKAILVDDERKICQLILELGDWKRFDINVESVCTDGEEALEAICRIRPDIVLTDVRMPVYDGLELIRRTTEQGLRPAFIIISGYKYFEYAYNAFKYGVIDYLLKPIDQEQLNEVLEKTCQIIRRQREYASAEDEIRRLSDHVELSNRRNLFRCLLEEGADFPKTPEELKLRFNKDFRFPCYRVFMLKTDRNLEDGSSLLLAQKIKEAVSRIFPEKRQETAAESGDSPCYKVCMETVHTGFAAILNYREEEQNRVKSRLQTLLYDVREMAGMFGISDITIGLGPQVESLSALPEAAAAAEEAEAAKVVLGGNRILDLAEYSFSRVGTGQLFGDREIRTLENALETLNQDLYTDLMEGVYSRMDTQPPVHPSVVKQICRIIWDAFDRRAEALRSGGEWENRRAGWQHRAAQASGLPAFFKVMEECGSEAVLEWKKQKQNEEKLPIRLAKAWIAEHYSDAVTLEMVADQVGLSPAYFSTHFRQVEGRTFSDYLTSVRMDAARELLSTTSMTNYEIADRIGYSDEKYFGKVFKKEVGIRPGEYRKLYFRG